MIYKVFYQKNKYQNPKREQTQTLYLEIGKESFEINSPKEREQRIIARQTIEQNTEYNIEYIQPLEGKYLEYEKNSGVFQLTEF